MALLDCGCTVKISYKASGNILVVNLDEVNYCLRHNDKTALVEVLESNAMVKYGDESFCWCDVPPFKSSDKHDDWCERARAALKLAKGEK